MVEIVSGSGIDRILSKNEVQEDRATRLNRLRAVEARDGRVEIRAAKVLFLVVDTDSVNRVLEETQGIDRLVTAGERLRQAAVLTDSFLKSYFISLVDPGRAMTMISPRDIARPLEEDG